MGTKNATEYRKMMTGMFTGLLQDSLDHPVEWHQSWKNAFSEVPRNAARGNRYNGINRFYLSMVACQSGITDPRWATMAQIKKEGWHLQKGSKGYEVEFWFPYDVEKRESISWDTYRMMKLNGDDIENVIIRPRYYYVFNASKIEGVPPLEVRETADIEPDELISRLSENMHVPIHHFINSGCAYRPSQDIIITPPPELFESSYQYNSSVLHELGHATGHESRLGRDILNAYGSDKYAREELVAEITSAFMGVHLRAPEIDIKDSEQHREYVRAWLQQLKNDPDLLDKALKDATAATAYMEEKAGLITKEQYVKSVTDTKDITVIDDGTAAELETPKQSMKQSPSGITMR